MWTSVLLYHSDPLCSTAGRTSGVEHGTERKPAHKLQSALAELYGEMICWEWKSSVYGKRPCSWWKKHTDCDLTNVFSWQNWILWDKEACGRYSCAVEICDKELGLELRKLVQSEGFCTWRGHLESFEVTEMFFCSPALKYLLFTSTERDSFDL